MAKKKIPGDHNTAGIASLVPGVKHSRLREGLEFSGGNNRFGWVKKKLFSSEIFDEIRAGGRIFLNIFFIYRVCGLCEQSYAD